MKQPKKPTLDQEKIIRRAGLDSDKWSVVKENDQYLYLVDRGMERREDLMIDKTTGEAVTKRLP